jgi:hypothetical protein
MTSVDFFALPPAAQDKLLAGCRGELDPRALLFRPGVRPTHLLWLLLVPASAAGAALLWFLGLGELDSPLARQPSAIIAAYVLCAAAFAFGVLQTLASRAVVARLPYRPGLYLFEAALIDARDRRLRVHPMATLTAARADGAGVALRFGAREFFFPVAAPQAAQALEMVNAAKARSGTLGETQRRILDPLEPPLVLGPFSSTTPLVPDRPLWVSLRPLFALAFGGVGVVAFSVRDDVSDERMFAAAKAQDDVAVYRRYLERGDDHRQLVEKELLPRAALRAAVSAGSVEAIDAFAQAYPDTSIQPEVDAARRAAVEAAFRAASDGTLASLLDFAAHHPGHHLETEWKAARHAVYLAALDRYQKVMPKQAKATRDFVAGLLDHAERVGPSQGGDGLRGPVVEIRMRRVASRALARADELVKRNLYYVGEVSLPTRYFDATHLAPLERTAAGELAATLQRHFPLDVVTFAPGESLEGSGETLPQSERPTLWVSYRVEPSGENYASKSPRGIYLGMVFFIRVDFVMPRGAGADLQSKHTFARKVSVDIVAKHDEKARSTLEAAIYGNMASEAFAELQKRYLAIWFDPALEAR